MTFEIYFIKYKHYIVEIETDILNVNYNKSYNGIIVNAEYAEYTIKKPKYKIISVKSIVDLSDIYDININIYNNNIIFKSYDRALYDNFLKANQWKLFSDGYSGVVKGYHPNGQLESELFIITTNDIAQIEGIAKYWYMNGMLSAELYYVNGLKEGICKIYNYDGIIENELYYVNGILKS